jgi:hypothetical protein
VVWWPWVPDRVARQRVRDDNSNGKTGMMRRDDKEGGAR